MEEIGAVELELAVYDVDRVVVVLFLQDGQELVQVVAHLADLGAALGLVQGKLLPVGDQLFFLLCLLRQRKRPPVVVGGIGVLRLLEDIPVVITLDFPEGKS